jgi:molecular chaperone GrpE
LRNSEKHCETGKLWLTEENQKLQALEEQVKQLSEALEAEKKRSQDYLNRLKYVQADCENLKKRYDRQIQEIRKYANEKLILELLDVLEELEMAVKSGKSGNSTEPVVQGVELTLKKLYKILENEGVAPIDCVGKPFDPTKHDAVARVEKEDTKGCTVVEQVRKGYTLKEKVIRPSIVKVVVQPTSKSQGEMKKDE